ncbi:fluoride efflux transporter CrcB [Streptomyces sp. NPDC059134]|uniref:fluoride efflux transporter CrcB n=1 Tax=Streptomyces sp. NPDC059134 TaxID=3346738 RepID=UPI0036CB2C4C
MTEPTDPDAEATATAAERAAPARHSGRPAPRSSRTPLRRLIPPAVAVVALGGAIGASARYGAALLWPTAPGAFPWTTLTVNAVGCAVIGVFMVVITDLWAAHPLVRPFFGTGVLGGFTTFSTYAVDIQRLVADGRAGPAMAYLGLTLLAAFAAVWSAVWATRRVLAWRQA